MKLTKFLALIAAAATLAVGCGGDKPEDEKKPAGGATLKADVLSVEVNNPITFTVTAEDGTDITADATIYDKTHDFQAVSNPFTPTSDGKYEFYAVAGNAITETIEVTVLPSIPALPADTNEASTEFKHRILLVDHTGNTCGYCPKMMLALKEVSETGDYHSKYYEAMSHSYASSDPATSASANAISSYYGVTSYPTLTYNFAYSTSSSYNAEHIKQQIDAQWKESADAGIAASASLATNSVVVNAEVKAAVENEYRITAWLLEDGIVAAQTNGTEEWMNTHNNAIRQAVKTNPISGMELGTIKAGEKASLAMSLEISGSKWVRDNLKVMVIASAKNANGKFEVVNVAMCPANGSVAYDYK
ncbi:MAG: Omp28-related outer membrane protein [Alistipes sp.]|nr:Omp28-related outer membrane protein [Alistipes sp.]MBR6630625.1 Omp28-related outer membrane protein [Alistipes sp.]